MSDPIYRQSSAQEVIVIARPVTTTTAIMAYGSGDGYTEPHTDFGSDETIMVAGTVVAVDGADLSRGNVQILLNGVLAGTVGLSYDPATQTNFYQFSLGVLAEGTYTVEANFRRIRI